MLRATRDHTVALPAIALSFPLSALLWHWAPAAARADVNIYPLDLFHAVSSLLFLNESWVNPAGLLYLFHLPLLNSLHSFRGEFASSALYQVTLVVVPLLLAGTVGHLCETQKLRLRRLLAGWLRLARPGHPSQASFP